VASSATRDFRQAEWRAFPSHASGDAFVYNLAIPESGFAAVFGEAVYNGDGGRYYLSTNVRVVQGSIASR
jgi:hypothetical protein